MPGVCSRLLHGSEGKLHSIRPHRILQFRGKHQEKSFNSRVMPISKDLQKVAKPD